MKRNAVKKYIMIRVEETVKDKFKKVCDLRGLDMSEVIREYVETLIKEA